MTAGDGSSHGQSQSTREDEYYIAPPLRNAAVDLESQPVVEPEPASVNINATPYSVNVDPPEDVLILPVPEHNHARGDEKTRDTSPFKLADFISSDPDLAIFRRFDRLTAHALLVQQRELQDCEVELITAQREDPFVATESQQTPHALRLRAQQGDGHARRRLDLETQLKWCLKEYQEALIRSAKILELSAPRTATRRALETWIGHSYRPRPNSDAHAFWMPYFPALPHAKVEHTTPLDKFLVQDDLLALRTPPEQDRLTELCENRFARLLKPRWRPHFREDAHREEDQKNGGIFYYPEQHLRTLVSLASLLLSFFLLVGAIIALYFIKEKGLKLALLVIFTLVFALTVGMCTNASRSEVFASTAGYAAVLVVFLGGNFSDAN